MSPIGRSSWRYSTGPKSTPPPASGRASRRSPPAPRAEALRRLRAHRSRRPPARAWRFRPAADAAFPMERAAGGRAARGRICDPQLLTRVGCGFLREAAPQPAPVLPGSSGVRAHHAVQGVPARCRPVPERAAVELPPAPLPLLLRRGGGGAARVPGARAVAAHARVAHRLPGRRRSRRAQQLAARGPDDVRQLAVVGREGEGRRRHDRPGAGLMVRAMSELTTEGLSDRTTRERLIDLIRQILGPPAASRPLPIDARLSELGMSSIKMVNLMLAIEVEFGLTIPQAEITPENFESIVSVERLVRRLGASSGGG